MKNKIFIKIVYISLLLILLGGCIYFYNESKKPEFKVVIGSPTSDEVIYYSDEIKDIKIIDTINLGLINAVSIEKPKITDNLPNAIFQVYRSKLGIQHNYYELWIENNQVIVGIGHKDTPGTREYKKISGSFNEDFINLISRYKSN